VDTGKSLTLLVSCGLSFHNSGMINWYGKFCSVIQPFQNLNVKKCSHKKLVIFQYFATILYSNYDISEDNVIHIISFCGYFQHTLSSIHPCNSSPVSNKKCPLVWMFHIPRPHYKESIFFILVLLRTKICSSNGTFQTMSCDCPTTGMELHIVLLLGIFRRVTRAPHFFKLVMYDTSSIRELSKVS
jgi:hypothetical protein